MDTTDIRTATDWLDGRDLCGLLREAISYDEVGDGTPVVLRTREGFDDIKDTIEVKLDGVYGIDTGNGVTNLATGDQLDLLRVREGTYGAPGQPQVYFEDGDAYGDVTDLFTVLKQELPNGTPSLENEQVEGLGSRIQGGYPLSDMECGLLLRLLAKYKAEIAALRASPDRDGQSYTSVPDPGTARIVGG